MLGLSWLSFLCENWAWLFHVLFSMILARSCKYSNGLEMRNPNQSSVSCQYGVLKSWGIPSHHHGEPIRKVTVFYDLDDNWGYPPWFRKSPHVPTSVWPMVAMALAIWLRSLGATSISLPREWKLGKEWKQICQYIPWHSIMFHHIHDFPAICHIPSKAWNVMTWKL